MNDPIWNDLPSGLSFWKIGNGIAEWTQGSPLHKIPEALDIVVPVDVGPDVDANVVTTNDTSVKKTTAIRKERLKKNVLQQLLPYIDESFSLYSPKFLANLEIAAKDQIRAFITNGAGAKLLGPKRCREVLSYLMTPMIHFNSSFVEMWSFLLQMPISCDGKDIAWNVMREHVSLSLTVITKN